jgi:hypothetical protein
VRVLSTRVAPGVPAPRLVELLEEKARVDGDLERLIAFTGCGRFGNLPIAERSRMHRQGAAMRMYSNVLAERIAAWED